VDAEHVSVLGNQLLVNQPLSTLFPTVPSIAGGAFDYLTNLGSLDQGESAARFEDISNEQIRHYKQTHANPTQTDYNTVNNLKLDSDYFHQTKIRRAAQIVAPKFAPVFERNAHEDWKEKAHNNLIDAQQAYQKDPSAANWRALQDAYGNQQYEAQRQTADNYFLLANFGGSASGAIFGNAKRIDADNTQERVNVRDKDAAAAAYAKDPSEENRLKLKVATLALKAWRSDKDENKGFTFASFKGLSPQQKLFSNLVGLKANQDEEDYWGRYFKASRQLTLLQRQQALQKAGGAAAQPNSVQNRLLAMSNYGPANQ